MSDTVEKIYCTDNNNDALLASVMGKNNNDPMAMAAMLNNNQWMNNPFIYLVFLMMFGRNGLWGNNNNVQDAEIQGQLNAIRTQMSDNQNSGLLMDAVKGNNTAITQLASNLNCDFNSLNNAICTVRSSVQDVAGQVGYTSEKVINAANLGDLNIVQQLKDCCCQTQQNLLKMGYEQQLATANQTSALSSNICNSTYSLNNAINTLSTGVERGFAATNYATQAQTCDILRDNQRNTQQIIDTLNSHWSQDLQQRYNDARLELSQVRQNQYLISQLKTTTTTA